MRLCGARPVDEIERQKDFRFERLAVDPEFPVVDVERREKRLCGGNAGRPVNAQRAVFVAVFFQEKRKLVLSVENGPRLVALGERRKMRPERPAVFLLLLKFQRAFEAFEEAAEASFVKFSAPTPR